MVPFYGTGLIASSEGSTGWLFGGYLVFFVCLLLYSWRIRRFLNAEFSDYASLRSGILHADADSLNMPGKFGNTCYSWGCFRAVVETDTHLFLSLGAMGAAEIIPKRSFPDPDAERAFAEYVRSRIASNAVEGASL